MSGEVPPAMSGTCGCSVNGHMYIFGGCDDDGQTNQVRLITEFIWFFCLCFCVVKKKIL